MPRLEEITYEAGRHALADQESFVAGIRQRAGTLLAAHALAASFLGATALREAGPAPLTWLALTTLVAGLVVAVVLLGPWRVEFALTADEVYDTAVHTAGEMRPDSLEWLVAVGFAYQKLRDHNAELVGWMTRLVTVLAGLVIVHAVLWIAALMGVE